MLPSHTSPQAGPALSILASLKSWHQTQSLCLQSLVEPTELPSRAAMVPYPSLPATPPHPTRTARAPSPDLARLLLSHPVTGAVSPVWCSREPFLGA